MARLNIKKIITQTLKQPFPCSMDHFSVLVGLDISVMAEVQEDTKSPDFHSSKHLWNKSQPYLLAQFLKWHNAPQFLF